MQHSLDAIDNSGTIEIGREETVEILNERLPVDAGKALALIENLCEHAVVAPGTEDKPRVEWVRHGWPMFPIVKSEAYSGGLAYWVFYLRRIIDKQRVLDVRLYREEDRARMNALARLQYVGWISADQLDMHESRVIIAASYRNREFCEYLLGVGYYLLSMVVSREYAAEWKAGRARLVLSTHFRPQDAEESRTATPAAPIEQSAPIGLEGQSTTARNPWPDCRWTADDWCNSELYEEYIEAVRTVLRGFDASMRVSYHNDNSEHREYCGRTFGEVSCLVAVWTPADPRNAMGGFLIRIFPDGRHIAIVSGGDASFNLVPIPESLTGIELELACRPLLMAIDSEFFNLEKRLKAEGALPVDPPPQFINTVEPPITDVSRGRVKSRVLQDATSDHLQPTRNAITAITERGADRLPADVLLVTVTQVESTAVRDLFQKATGRQPEPMTVDDRIYHDLGRVNGARVFMAQSEMGTSGLGGSLQTVSRAIAALSPSAVVMVGIAFGVNSQKQCIGDILVSQQLMLYELQRVGNEEGTLQIIRRGDRPHASPRLINRCQAADLTWDQKEAKVMFGLILSGDKLVDNLDFRSQLLTFEQEAIGGEMEAAGLYAACHVAKVDWIVIKAICDWADGHKEAGKDQRQELAAYNAAQFALHMLQYAPWHEQNAASACSLD